MAGLCSGLTEAVVVCPFETVKVRLQAEHNITMAQVRFMKYLELNNLLSVIAKKHSCSSP